MSYAVVYDVQSSADSSVKKEFGVWALTNINEKLIRLKDVDITGNIAEEDQGKGNQELPEPV